ncbi:MAG: hypothetical protein S4CHLAM20_02110 [Chlamydiia bacterium]|jgi:hypothetical protein|nr:hypothetical protein [Chlamydiia bacterium]
MDQRRTTFEEPNWLEIPPSVRIRFDNEGMALRWIRISIRNQEDYQNVGKRTAEGWEFVQAEEVPEMLQSSDVREGGRYEGAVCRGDLALAKMPAELAESRQEFYENRSREMVDAVNAQLMNSSDSRMPISNQSRTQISRGKQPKFQD